jgi:hypothetical protein
MYRSDTEPTTMLELSQYTLPTFKTAPPQPKEITEPLPQCEKEFEKHVVKDPEHDKNGPFSKLIDGAKRKLGLLLHSVDEDAAFNRFTSHFPTLIHDDRLLGEFQATLCCSNGRVRGFLMLTSHHILFMGAEDQSLKVITPFTDVDSYNIMAPQTVTAAAARTESFSGHVRVMREMDTTIPPKDKDVAGQEIFQIFLQTKQLLIFHEIDRVRDCINIFDHTWRACGIRRIDEPTPTPSESTNAMCECQCDNCSKAACAACVTGKCAFKSVNMQDTEEDRRARSAKIAPTIVNTDQPATINKDQLNVNSLSSLNTAPTIDTTPDTLPPINMNLNFNANETPITINTDNEPHALPAVTQEAQINAQNALNAEPVITAAQQPLTIQPLPATEPMQADITPQSVQVHPTMEQRRPAPIDTSAIKAARMHVAASTA